MKIYVGNLDYDVTEDQLRTEFSAFGKVDSVSMISDRDTGRSKGFAFIEMTSIPEGQAAIEGMNGKVLKDRTLIVNAARPRTEDRGGGGSYGGRKNSFDKNRGRRY
jgi:cold-inducible RNA-binding protein